MKGEREVVIKSRKIVGVDNGRSMSVMGSPLEDIEEGVRDRHSDWVPPMRTQRDGGIETSRQF